MESSSSCEVLAMSLIAMSSAAVISVAVGVVLVLGAVVALTAARRTDVRGAGALSRETRKRDRDAEIDGPPTVEATRAEVEQAGAQARAGTAVATRVDTVPVVWTPPDPEALAVSRRQFLNRAQVSLMAAGLGAFAAAGFTAFLWPTATGGFGGQVSVGKLDDILAGIRSNSGFFYSATARSHITAYPSEALPKAEAVANYQPVMSAMQAGISVLYQKCPHLGCRVPECKTSQWFECPCHGSQYNRNGEKKGGPAPRGMDLFVATIAASGDVTVDTATVFPGVPIGTNTTGQEAEGPHCISAGGGGH
jgi:cytochrome b6-f complex iron-sulfur subunit